MYQLYYLKSTFPQEMEEQFSIHPLFIKFNLLNFASKTNNYMRINAFLMLFQVQLFFTAINLRKNKIFKENKMFQDAMTLN